MGAQCKVLNCKVQGTQETNYKEMKSLFCNDMLRYEDSVIMEVCPMNV